MNHLATDWEHDYPHLMHFVTAIKALRACADMAITQRDTQTEVVCEETIQRLLRLRNARKARTDLNRAGVVDETL
jgi:hypothetical protein